MAKSIEVAIRKMNEQNERLVKATKKRVDRFLKLADGAKTEVQKARYTKTAMRTVEMTHAQISKSQKIIDKLKG
jgi:hypothetical protein